MTKNMHHGMYKLN